MWNWFRNWFRRRQRPTPEPQSAPTAPPPASSAPLERRVIRVTDPADGPWLNRGYSYWPQAFVRDGVAYVFAGHSDGTPRFFDVELATGAVRPFHAQVPYVGTTEGWYWNRDGWIVLCDGPRLRRVNPFTAEDQIVFDISETQPGCRLWQAHSSEDGQTHSATVQRIVQDGAYPNIWTVVFRLGQVRVYGAHGALDESQVSPDGRYLVIKEDDDNRIITLDTDEERLLVNSAGALGHSDLGHGFMVGENDQAGTCDYVDLLTLHRRALFGTWNMGYVAVRGNVCLHSGSTHLNLVALDGSSFLPLIEHGGGQDYDSRVKANLSPCGRVASYVSQGAVYVLVL